MTRAERDCRQQVLLHLMCARSGPQLKVYADEYARLMRLDAVEGEGSASASPPRAHIGVRGGLSLSPAVAA